MVYKKTGEWYEWQQMTMSDDEWRQVVKRKTTSGTTSDNEWRVIVSANFPFFTNKRGT